MVARGQPSVTVMPGVTLQPYLTKRIRWSCRCLGPRGPSPRWCNLPPDYTLSDWPRPLLRYCPIWRNINASILTNINNATCLLTNILDFTTKMGLPFLDFPKHSLENRTIAREFSWALELELKVIYRVKILKVVLLMILINLWHNLHLGRMVTLNIS